MAYLNPLVERWQMGGVTYGGWLVSADPAMAEILAGCGFDEVCADQQHGDIGPQDLVSLFQAIAGGGAVPTTRVAANDASLIGKALDVGALGIIVPMVESAEAAQAVVRAIRFAPRGSRSIGPLRTGAAGRSFDPADLEAVAVVVMIETARGVDRVDEITAVPGIDAVYVGPGDLALSLGLPLRPADRTAEQAALHAEAVERVRRSCEASGIVAGIHTGDGVTASRYVEQGFRMVTVVSDFGLISAGGQRELAAARAVRTGDGLVDGEASR